VIADPEAIVRRRRLDRALNNILLVVAVQFALGIWLNLFGSFPRGSSSLVSAITDAANPILVAHIVVGILLLLAAISVLVLSRRDPFRRLRALSVAGIVAMVVTGFFGLSFVYSGYSNNVASFAMALGFVAIVTIYYESLVALRSHPLALAKVPDRSA
jgi:drug/metabolite transporter (DMT)-like permease